jgi:uncharacterized protein YjiS (DUF1127 family)
MHTSNPGNFLMNQLVLPFRPVDHLLAALAKLRQRLREARQRRRRIADARDAMAALSQLDARTLHDIGLHRSEIASAAWELNRLAPAQRRTT